MPVTFSVFVSSIFHDLVVMNIPVPPLNLPLFGLVAFGMIVSFITAWLALRWVSLEKKYAYGLAGCLALLFIVVLMPLAFFGLDFIAGARTPLGKTYLIFCGFIGGYFFGANLKKGEV